MKGEAAGKFVSVFFRRADYADFTEKEKEENPRFPRNSAPENIIMQACTRFPDRPGMPHLPGYRHL